MSIASPMVRRLAPAFIAVLIGVACATIALAGAANPAGLTSDGGRLGYSLGVNIGRELRSLKLEVDAKAVAQGLEDSLSGAPLKLDEKTRQDSLKLAAIELQQEYVEEQLKLIEANEPK